MCNCAVCVTLRHVVIPTSPDPVPDPWKMEPGDCQRALAELWDALKRQEP